MYYMLFMYLLMYGQRARRGQRPGEDKANKLIVKLINHKHNIKQLKHKTRPGARTRRRPHGPSGRGDNNNHTILVFIEHCSGFNHVFNQYITYQFIKHQCSWAAR